jgi:hypothetical protein
MCRALDATIRVPDWLYRSPVENRGFGSPLGSLRTAEGGKSGINERRYPTSRHYCIIFRLEVPHVGYASMRGPTYPWLRPIVQTLVSLAILGAAIYMILSRNYDAQNKHWAYAYAGTILGFWLRGSK